MSDHVNETFEGLNKLTEDSEIVWWYKELIVQTVLHFTLQEREKAIREGLNMITMIRENIMYKTENQLYKYCDDKIAELSKLKTP